MTLLSHELYPGEGEPVLAIHGISSNRKMWQWLHAAAPEIPILAPDLRGRGDSVQVGPPYRIDQHVADLVGLLDERGLESVHVVGMSMGAFIAVALADQHPGRVRGLVLVDGGPPVAKPEGMTQESMSEVFAGRMRRVSRTWDSTEAYRDAFCEDVAPLLDREDPLLASYLTHDLVDGKERLDADALVGDGVDVYFGENAFARLPAELPRHFVHAQWSVGEDSPPFYGPDQVAELTAHGVPTTLVEGVDRAGLVMTPTGAEVVAGVLRELRARG